MATRGASALLYAGSWAETFSADLDEGAGSYALTYERAAADIGLTASNGTVLGSGGSAGDAVIDASAISLTKYADTIEVLSSVRTNTQTSPA